MGTGPKFDTRGKSWLDISGMLVITMRPVVNGTDVQVVLCVSQDVDVAMGLISSHRLGDAFDFVGVHRELLPTVRL